MNIQRICACCQKIIEGDQHGRGNFYYCDDCLRCIGGCCGGNR